MTESEQKQATVQADANVFAGGLGAVISGIVQRTWAEPFMLIRRVFGEGAETALEGAARALGRIAGQLTKSSYGANRNPSDHALEDTLKATVLAENLTGILGENYYVNEKKVVRRVHTCPFRAQPGARILCHLGESAGQELFQELVPGIRHKVHVTMARGHAFCEYSYEID